MASKLYLCLSLIILVYSDIVLGYRVQRDVEYKNADEMDRKIIEETGCKYLYLAANESAWFTKSNVEHTTMATLVSDETLADQQQTTFKTHFAVRSASDLTVQMFSRRWYVNQSRTEPDYEIAFGVKGNQKSYLRFVSRNIDKAQSMGKYREEFTRYLLSEYQYVKLYISIDPSNLKFGKHCERTPMEREEQFAIGPLEIVQFGFLAKAATGAKILYDCPSEFAGCPCDWIIH